MKRAYRWTLLGIAALVLLPVLFVLVVVLVIDPNAYRGQIESAARSRLGIPLTLQGDLRWRVWPMLSIEAGAGRIGADDANPGDVLARWQTLQFGAQWRALLRRELLIDRLQIDALQLQLRVDAQGRGNWQPWLDDASRERAGGARAASNQRWQVTELRLRDAGIDWSDARSGSRWQFDALSFDAGIDYESASQRLTLDDPQLKFRARGGSLPAAGLVAELSADPLTFDGRQHAVTLPTMRLTIGEAGLELSLTEPLQFSPLAGTGTLQLAVDSSRETLAMLGIVAPPTRDDDVLGELQVQADWELSPSRLDLSELKVVADDTNITGSAMWPIDDSSPALFELTGDDIDLDRYLRPAGAPREPFILPVESLRELAIEGSISFRSVKLRGITMRNTRFDVPKS